MKIYTIGFTGKAAPEFFGLLKSTDARYLVDIRLHNNSQLAGFTKKGSIEFFTEELTGMTYLELPLLAPEKEMFQEYRKEGDWNLYESQYNRLLEERAAESQVGPNILEAGIVLLCSERTAEKCHRRLAAEYLKVSRFPQAEIVHL